MNDDLISRSALRKDIERLYSVYKDNKDYFYTDVLDHIDNAPTVEYTFEEAFQKTVCEQRLYCPEKPHGEWITEDKLYGGFGDRVLVNTCSICKTSFVYRGKTHNFCSNCGADMRKEADNE